MKIKRKLRIIYILLAIIMLTIVSFLLHKNVNNNEDIENIIEEDTEIIEEVREIDYSEYIEVNIYGKN